MSKLYTHIRDLIKENCRNSALYLYMVRNQNIEDIQKKLGYSDRETKKAILRQYTKLCTQVIYKTSIPLFDILVHHDAIAMCTPSEIKTKLINVSYKEELKGDQWG